MAIHMDLIIGRVRGAVSAKDVRVIWTAGKLYICKSPTDITVFETEEPRRSGGFYKTTVDDRFITLQPPACGSCRRRVRESAIGQMTVEQIVEAASVDA